MAVNILEELEGSPTFSFSKYKASAKRVVRIPWNKIEEYGKQMLGEGWPGGGGSGTAAAFPGMSWLFATSLQVDPMIGDSPDGNAASGNDLNTYTTAGAKVTISFSTNDATNESNDGRRINLQVGAEFLTLPHTSLEWESDSKKLEGEVQAGFLIPKVEHSREYKNITSIPYSAIRAAIGKVNNATWNGASTEYVLFVGCDITEERDKQGNLVYSVGYKFSEKQLSWNKQFRPGAGWQYVTISGGGGRPYATADFSSLG